MNKLSVLYQVLSSGEAERLWGLSQGTVKVYCKRGMFMPHEARKSENTWLVTKEGMERVFGKAQLSQEILWGEGLDMIKYEDLEYDEQHAINAISWYVESVAELNKDIVEGGEPHTVEREDLELHVETIFDQYHIPYTKIKTKGKTSYKGKIGDSAFVETAYFRNNQYTRYTIEGVEF